MAGKITNRKPRSPKLTALQAECDRLRDTVTQLAAERDQYLTTLYALTRKNAAHLALAPEDLAPLIDVEPDELAKELRRRERNHSCPSTPPTSSASAGRRKTVKS